MFIVLIQSLTIYLSLYNKLAYIDTSLIINKNKKNAKLPILTKLIIRQHRIIPTRVRIKKNAIQIPTLKWTVKESNKSINITSIIDIS